MRLPQEFCKYFKCFCFLLALLATKACLCFFLLFLIFGLFGQYDVYKKVTAILIGFPPPIATQLQFAGAPNRINYWGRPRISERSANQAPRNTRLVLRPKVGIGEALRPGSKAQQQKKVVQPVTSQPGGRVQL